MLTSDPAQLVGDRLRAARSERGLSVRGLADISDLAFNTISLIERGRQSFTHRGTKYSTSSGGVILINPGAVHTGEAADEHGFELRSIYPSLTLMKTAAFELSGRQQAIPFFKDVRIDDHWAANAIFAAIGVWLTLTVNR